MSEYYIKQPDTDHARGPLSLEQLISLAETGNITEDTLLYDEISEKWKPLTAFHDLLPLVFPEKKKLSLNRIEAVPTEDHVASEIAEGKVKPKVSTESILAAASGDTKETKHIGNRRKSKEKAAELAVPGIGALLAICAVALIFPSKNLVIAALSSEEAVFGILINPMVLLGLVHAAFSVGVFLGVTSLFPYVRFFAALAFGMMGYLFWAWENPLLAGGAMLMSAGLFGATISTRYFWMLLSLMLGFVGAIAIAYFAVTGVIVYP